MNTLSILLPSALATLAGVELIRRWALHKELLDHPNERSSHTHPTPRGGGLAIVIVTLAAMGAWLFLHRAELPQPLWRYGLAGLGGALIAFVSWLDDSRGGVHSAVRYGVHAVGAAMAMYAFGWWHDIYLPFLGTVQWGWLGLAVTFIWITGLVNAYNFMDGIDGIAGSQALTASLTWFIPGTILLQYLGYPTMAVFALILLGTALGFLVLNWHPAKIFMGDVGSAFLGYVFAVLPLLFQADRGETGGRFPIFAFLAVAPFVLDASFTFLRRLRKRENVFAAHRSHLYQRLVISGLSHQTVTLVYLALGLVGAMTAQVFCDTEMRRLGDIAAVAAPLLILGLPLGWVWVREKKKV